MSTVASQVACKHGVDVSRDFTRASIKRYTKSRDTSREIYKVYIDRSGKLNQMLVPLIMAFLLHENKTTLHTSIMYINNNLYSLSTLATFKTFKTVTYKKQMVKIQPPI